MLKPRNSCGDALPAMQVQFAPYTTMPKCQTQPCQPSQQMPIPMPPLPTGVPIGPMYGGMAPTSQATLMPSVPSMLPVSPISPMPSIPSMPLVPSIPSAEQPPQSVQSPYYLAGFLRRHIGRMMRVEFLIGTTAPLIDRIGTLVDVGASYIVLKLIGTDDMVVCDLYSIKFVTIYR